MKQVFFILLAFLIVAAFSTTATAQSPYYENANVKARLTSYGALELWNKTQCLGDFEAYYMRSDGSFIYDVPALVGQWVYPKGGAEFYGLPEGKYTIRIRPMFTCPGFPTNEWLEIPHE